MHIYHSDFVETVKNKVYPHQKSINSVTDLKQAVCYDHIMAKCEGSTRGGENFIESDVLFADVDNSHSDTPTDWVTIEQGMETFHDIEFYLVSSRNHLKDKTDSNGAVLAARPKFHLYFPISNITDKDEFESYLRSLTTAYPFLDRSVKDATRFFFGNPNAQVLYNEGESILNALSMVKANPGAKQKDKKQKATTPIVTTLPIGYVTENRNTTLYHYARDLYQQGETALVVLERLSQVNAKRCKPPLDEAEVESISKNALTYGVKKSTRIRNYSFSEDEEGNRRTTPLVSFTEEMKLPLSELYAVEDQQGVRTMYLRRNDYLIADSNQLCEALRQLGYDLDFRSKGKTKGEYLEHLKQACASYDRVSLLPEIHQDEKTKYTNEAITPEHNGYLRRLLSTFTVKDLKDEYRLLAGFISGFFGRDFDGERPLFSVIADHCTSGKTTVVRVGCSVMQGVNPIELVGDPNKDKEAIGSIQSLANKFALYDNLEKLKQEERTHITKTVTDKYISSHFMYISHSRVRNNKTFFATFNSTTMLNRDLIERALVIRMQDGRDIDQKKKGQIREILRTFEKNRVKVVADLLWYLQRVSWDEPLTVDFVPHQKCSQWSEVMTRILHVIYPEVSEFDFGLSEQDKEFDDDLGLFNEMLDEIISQADKDEVFVRNTRMREVYRDTYGLSDRVATQTAVAKKVRTMAKSLDRYRIESDRRQQGSERTRGWVITRIR